MTATATATATATIEEQAAPTAVEGDLLGSDVVEQDLLVEDVSIDGMCGVY
jgi:mycofactocin precursor